MATVASNCCRKALTSRMPRPLVFGPSKGGRQPDTLVADDVCWLGNAPPKKEYLSGCGIAELIAAAISCWSTGHTGLTQR
jgi:hypothetical protein